MANGKNFIKGAIHHPHRLQNLAQSENKTVNEVAAEHEHNSGGLGDAARMYENVLKPINHGRHPHADGQKHGDGPKGSHWSKH